jgi:hypothetical protein
MESTKGTMIKLISVIIKPILSDPFPQVSTIHLSTDEFSPKRKNGLSDCYVAEFDLFLFFFFFSFFFFAAVS